MQRTRHRLAKRRGASKNEKVSEKDNEEEKEKGHRKEQETGKEKWLEEGKEEGEEGGGDRDSKRDGGFVSRQADIRGSSRSSETCLGYVCCPETR